jgi:hypothetical protein
VVVPRDADGHAVKATGTLAVTAFQITSEGLKQPFGSWELTSTELRATWRAGLLSTGYQVTLPFREPPTRERMYVVARFTALSGQPYEADQTVRIRTGCALPGRAAPAPPLPVPQPAADLPSPPEGPAPKPVEGPAPRPVEVPVKPPAEVVPPLQGPALTVPAAKVSVSLLPVQPRVVTPVPEPTLVPHPGTEAPSGTQP